MRLATCLSVAAFLMLTTQLSAQKIAGKGAGGPAAAAEAVKVKPDAPILPEAVKLVEQLGDPDFRQRDAAAKALRALGDKALGALRQAMKHEDPEVQRRVNVLLPALETAALLAPQRVTVHLKKKTVRQIMDELQKKTGYKIEFWGGNQQQLFDLDCDNLPFWEAFDRLCQSAGLVLQIGYGDNVIRLNHQDSYVPYVAHKGAFRLVANSFNYNRSIDFSALNKNTGGMNRTESLGFNFTVCVEPRIPLMNVGTPHLTEAVDNEGRSMLLTAPGMDGMGDVMGGRHFSRYGNGNMTYAIQSYVNLGRPSEKSRSVKSLKGSVPVTLLANKKPEVVSDDILKAKGTKKEVGNVTFNIQDVTQTPNKQYSVKMSITNHDKDNPNDYTWMNSLYYRIELQDAKGVKYNHYGSSWSGNGQNHVDLTFTYGNPGNAKIEAPKKLIYYVWTLVNHQVEFEFKDLPLP